MKAGALLRGINVGAQTRVPMPELRDVFESLSLTEVESYLSLDYFERTLGTVGTARNWKTVVKLRELLVS